MINIVINSQVVLHVENSKSKPNMINNTHMQSNFIFKWATVSQTANCKCL